MRNAQELYAIVSMKKTIEDLTAKAEALEKFKRLTERYLKNIPRLDEYVEALLLEHNGTATLLLGEERWCQTSATKDNGFACVIEKNTTSYPRNHYPYWDHNYPIKGDSFLNINDYAEYLRRHGYKVTITNADFTASSSSGKTECVMWAKAMKISVT